jgi:hypothetical protein
MHTCTAKHIIACTLPTIKVEVNSTFFSQFKLLTKLQMENSEFKKSTSYTINKSLLFKMLLLSLSLTVAVYTGMVIQKEGINFFAVFIENMLAVNWNGQFHIDFMCYLILSGLWIMWRERFSVSSIALACCAMVIGFIFLAPYVLYLLAKENGNFKKVLTGD